MEAQLNRAGQVRLVIPGKFDGVAGRQGDQLAFVATRRLAPGVRAAAIDGEDAQIDVAFGHDQERAAMPLMLATIL